MDKKFNSFLLILGIIFTLITGLFQFFIKLLIYKNICSKLYLNERTLYFVGL